MLYFVKIYDYDFLHHTCIGVLWSKIKILLIGVMVSGAWTEPKESTAGIGDSVSDLCCVYQVWMGLNDCPSGSNIATPMCP